MNERAVRLYFMKVCTLLVVCNGSQAHTLIAQVLRGIVPLYIPYSLDQTPLSISRRTSRCAERNSRRSRIAAAFHLKPTGHTYISPRVNVFMLLFSDSDEVASFVTALKLQAVEFAE